MPIDMKQIRYGSRAIKDIEDLKKSSGTEGGTSFSGFFKPLDRDTSYSFGDNVYSPNLPSYFYLECYTSGTTGSTEPDMTSVGEEGLITDGTAVFMVRRLNLSPITTEYRNTYVRGREITESWESLVARVKKGDFSNLYIGDWKKATFKSGLSMIMEIAGIDTYYGAGSYEIGHHIDFISRDCLPGVQKMNSTATNNGTMYNNTPWGGSELYSSMNMSMFENLSDDLRPYIVEKHTYMEDRYSSKRDAKKNTALNWGNAGKLWVPSEIEVFGSFFIGEMLGATLPIQYPLFKIGGCKHIIKKVDVYGDGLTYKRCSWWLSTPHKDNSLGFCAVGSLGVVKWEPANSVGIYVPLCFRIG